MNAGDIIEWKLSGSDDPAHHGVVVQVVRGFGYKVVGFYVSLNGSVIVNRADTEDDEEPEVWH